MQIMSLNTKLEILAYHMILLYQNNIHCKTNYNQFTMIVVCYLRQKIIDGWDKNKLFTLQTNIDRKMYESPMVALCLISLCFRYTIEVADFDFAQANDLEYMTFGQRLKAALNNYLNRPDQYVNDPFHNINECRKYGSIQWLRKSLCCPFVSWRFISLWMS